MGLKLKICSHRLDIKSRFAYNHGPCDESDEGPCDESDEGDEGEEGRGCHVEDRHCERDRCRDRSQAHDCKGALESLVAVGTKEVKSTGKFTIHGLVMVKTRMKPATKAGKREMFGVVKMVKAKPAM